MPILTARPIPAAARCAILAVVVFAAACAQVPTGGLAQPEASPARQVTVLDPEPAATQVPALPEPPPPVAVKPPPADLWERLRAGFTLPAMDNDLVRNWETYYSSRPDYVAGMVERGSHYLYHILEEVERRKMPAEIALLPMIESAYNPQAYSRAHASGLWQFIPSTGKLYGLRQNWWYDGRRDVIAATSAALDYLEKLYAQFGDWELALASYNWGEGAVARAVARNQTKGKPADYSSLAMPAETRNYLPKLIAVRNIVSDPARFGLQLAPVPNEPYFAVITVQQHIDVKLAAKFAEMPLDEFKFLNPAHNKPVIKAGAAETIVLPRDRVAAFNANLEKHDEPLVSWQAHTLKKGERPEKVAARYGISMSELKQVNGITARNTFRVGQALLVPVQEGATPNLPDLPAAPVTMTRAYKAARARNASRATGSKPAARKTVAAKSKSVHHARSVKPGTAKPRESAKSTVVAQTR